VKVAEEIKLLKENYPVDTFWFVDDVFTISEKWLREFSQQVKCRNLSFKYECITRADRMDEAVVKLLKESGCFRVWIGAESGSQKVIDAMDRRVDVKQVRSMIRLAKKHGIQAGTFIMLGYPGETEEDIEETVRHLKASDPDLYTITVAYPIKGTPMYEEVENLFTLQLPWQSSTDRNIDFRRTYPRRYYDFAVRYVHNEMACHKALKNGSPLIKMPVYKLKSLAAKGRMIIERWK
jgi:radical SAM superfamily enzyme YgiQ (UPF0313 family)